MGQNQQPLAHSAQMLLVQNQHPLAHSAQMLQLLLHLLSALGVIHHQTYLIGS